MSSSAAPATPASGIWGCCRRSPEVCSPSSFLEGMGSREQAYFGVDGLMVSPLVELPDDIAPFASPLVEAFFIA